MNDQIPGVLPDRLQLSDRTTLHAFSIDQTSYLVVRDGRSLLVNCHSPWLPKTLRCMQLPSPELILHTHVTPEHCREADGFPEAEIRVPEGQEILAGDHARWHELAHTTWDDPAAWGATGGAERFGVAGCITDFPPAAELRLGRSLKAGETIAWNGLDIEIISLPAYGKQALGFVLRESGATLGVFIGDLFRHPAVLVDFHGLERRYGGTCIAQIPAMLRQVADLGTDRFFPSTGPLMLNGPAQARELAAKIDAYLAALKWPAPGFQAEEPPPCPTLGRWNVVHDGVYQITGFGNTIVFIDEEGRGLVFDPGHCEYEQGDQRYANFIADFVVLEEQAGLKRVDLALVTHHHGDHYDMGNLLIERYGTVVGAWDLVARAIKAPWDVPYCCTLPWYGLAHDHVPIGLTLSGEEPYDWHGVAIRSVHLPGHSYCHAGYIFTFRGKRFAITGDTIQNRGGASGLGFIIGNHSVPGDGGDLRAFRTMCEQEIDINLGGHGSRFTNCQALYEASARRIEHAMPFLRALIPNGDFHRAFFRPGFPRMDRFG